MRLMLLRRLYFPAFSISFYYSCLLCSGPQWKVPQAYSQAPRPGKTHKDSSNTPARLIYKIEANETLISALHLPEE